VFLGDFEEMEKNVHGDTERVSHTFVCMMKSTRRTERICMFSAGKNAYDHKRISKKFEDIRQIVNLFNV
jgi:CRISPR/Cas system CMR-associated protein Cmr1 (group 7 of RAMP superfamily)